MPGHKSQLFTTPRVCEQTLRRWLPSSRSFQSSSEIKTNRLRTANDSALKTPSERTPCGLKTVRKGSGEERPPPPGCFCTHPWHGSALTKGQHARTLRQRLVHSCWVPGAGTRGPTTPMPHLYNSKGAGLGDSHLFEIPASLNSDEVSRHVSQEYIRITDIYTHTFACRQLENPPQTTDASQAPFPLEYSKSVLP